MIDEEALLVVGGSHAEIPLIDAAHATTVDAVVDHFVSRFLSVGLAQKDRAVLVEFLRGKLGTFVER